MRTTSRLVLPAALPAVLATAVLALAGCGGSDSEATDSSTGGPSAGSSSDASASYAAGTQACTYSTDAAGPAAKQVNQPPSTALASGPVSITMTTNDGAIGATLDADKAPCTVSSFLSLADQKYFDDTPCHRLTTDGIYVLQCGDPTGQGTGGPGYTIPDELSGKETYGPGTLAMAKTQAPNSGGSQFFIVYADSSSLPPNYTVFGQIDDAGLAVVKKIAAAGTADGSPDGAPKDPVTIQSVTVG